MLLPKTHMSYYCLFAVAVAGLSPSTAEAQAKLRWKFQEGETLNYVMTQNMTQSMNVMGNDIKTKMNQVMEMSWTIEKINSDGSAKMIQKFTRIQFKMTLPPPLSQTIEYDSKDGKVPEGQFGKVFAGIFAAIAGAETSLTIDPMGNISDYKLSEKLLKALKQNGRGNVGGGAFSEESLKQMGSQGFLSFPMKSLSKGEKWDKKLETKMPFGTMKMETKYTYDGKAKNGLESILSSVAVSLESGPNAQFQLKMKESDSSGKILFDNKAGRLKESNMEQTMTMEITAGGMMFEQKTNSLTTMKLVTGDSKKQE